MRHLVIGLGEVGNALMEVLSTSKAIGYDKNKEGFNDLPASGFDFEMLHICFPYSANFEEDVRRYQMMYRPKYVVVHATVPIGTCRANGWTHSPVRGKHPDLAKSLTTFVKYVSGVNALAVVREFKKFNILAKLVTKSDETEAGKLYDLMQYAVSILLSKHIYKMCEEKGLSFDLVYREFNKTYNDGYWEMGMLEVNRPVLEYRPGPIGGHCVVPMMSLLDDQLAKDIINANKNL